jgi:membrane dipeptidase
VAHAQLAYYELLEARGSIRLIRTRGEMDDHWRRWTSGGEERVGVILSMEGADPVVMPEHVRRWHDKGLRAIGPCHFGPSHYGIGSGGDGPLSEMGVRLLESMAPLNMILDVTHLSDTSLLQSIDLYGGPIWASHHNCRALVTHDRQLTDAMIRLLVERDAVIGAVLCNWMLHEGYDSEGTPREAIEMGHVADHIDHVCQLAGNARHAAIGSDLDGGFGTEMSPIDLDTITDLQKLDGILGRRGYSDEDIDAIFHGNWLRALRASLPA